jgi:hypothetical protein
MSTNAPPGSTTDAATTLTVLTTIPMKMKTDTLVHVTTATLATDIWILAVAASMKMNAQQKTSHALKIRIALMPSVVTHVPAMMASQRLQAAVSTLTNVQLPIHVHNCVSTFQAASSAPVAMDTFPTPPLTLH